MHRIWRTSARSRVMWSSGKALTAVGSAARSAAAEDIEDVLGGLETVHAGVRPGIATADPAHAEQTGRALAGLEDFAAGLRRQEAGGRRLAAEDADTLGGEAQDPAEAIAGQIAQAAGRLHVPLET